MLNNIILTSFFLSPLSPPPPPPLSLSLSLSCFVFSVFSCFPCHQSTNRPHHIVRSQQAKETWTRPTRSVCHIPRRFPRLPASVITMSPYCKHAMHIHLSTKYILGKHNRSLCEFMVCLIIFHLKFLMEKINYFHALSLAPFELLFNTLIE